MDYQPSTYGALAQYLATWTDMGKRSLPGPVFASPDTLRRIRQDFGDFGIDDPGELTLDTGWYGVVRVLSDPDVPDGEFRVRKV